MHAMNASSLHLWLGFHSVLKCCSPEAVPKAWTRTLQLQAKLPDFSSVQSVSGQIWETQSCPWCHHSDPAELALSGYRSCSGGAVFHFPAWMRQPRRHGYSWATAGSGCSAEPWIPQDPASGHHRTSGNAVHTLMFPPPSHPYTRDFLIYFCSLLPGELNESKERSGKCLKKQLILSFHLGTETQIYLLGQSLRHVLVVA